MLIQQVQVQPSIIMNLDPEEDYVCNTGFIFTPQAKYADKL